LISHTTNLEDALEEFYYNELEVEYEKLPDRFRRKEAHKRAIRALNFYNAYREYEQTGFDTDQIEKLFGIDKQNQKILNYWIDKILPRGMASIGFARQGMGKSNVISFFIQSVLVVRPNWEPVTNIPFAFATDSLPDYHIDRIHIVSSFTEMLEAMAKLVLAKKGVPTFIDEMDSAYQAVQTRGRRGVSFKSFVYIERHLNCKGPFMIYHRGEDIPIEMRNEDIAAGIYEVAKYNNFVRGISKRVISSPDLFHSSRLEGYERYFPVPLTMLPYHNQGFSPFKMDVSMQWINARLIGTQEEASVQLLDLIKKWRDMSPQQRKKAWTEEE
jgi:hypothetical protein